jgi:N-glycosylase/DNA lyase
LCTLFGDEIKLNNMTSYTFPTPEQILTRAGIRGLISIGLGYRAHYVYRVAELISSGKYNLEILKLKSKDEAEQELLKLYGVGPKVANCTLLFGLGHVDAFPIDVWIQRIISEVYNGYLDISPFKGVAGIVQQYMFYYMRTSYYNR